MLLAVEFGLRIFYAVVFAYIAWQLIMWPACFAAVCPYFRALRLNQAARVRLDEAAQARKSAEGISMRLGYFPGIVWAAAAAACVLTHLPVAALFAIPNAALGATVGVAYLQFRGAVRRRAASLTPRKAMAAIHPIVWLCALLAVMAPLAYSDILWMRILVCVAGAVNLAMAWLVARSATLIVGEDLPMAWFVDGRLRLYRTGTLLATASGPAFFMMANSQAQTDTFGDVLQYGVMAIWLATFVWSMVLPKRKPDGNEIASLNLTGSTSG